MGEAEPDDIDYIDAKIRHHEGEAWHWRSIKKRVLEAKALKAENESLRAQIADDNSKMQNMRLIIDDLLQVNAELRHNNSLLWREKEQQKAQNGQLRQMWHWHQRERSPGGRSSPRVQHNHFESGSQAMIFNGEVVNGKFTKDTQDRQDGTQQGRCDEKRNN